MSLKIAYRRFAWSERYMHVHVFVVVVWVWYYARVRVCARALARFPSVLIVLNKV